MALTMKEQEQTELTEEQRELIRENAGFIGDIAKEYYDGVGANMFDYSYTDLFNQGVLGFCRAMRTFDTSRGTQIRTYAKPWVRRYIQSLVARPRHVDKLKNRRNLDDIVINGDGESVTLMDMVECDKTDAKSFGNELDRDVLKDVLSSGLLTPIELEVINLRFFEGLKHEEINTIIQKKRGFEKARAFYYLNTAMKKLKKALVTN